MIDEPIWERERKMKRLIPLLALLFFASAVIISYHLGRQDFNPDLTGAVTGAQEGYFRNRGTIGIQTILIDDYSIPHPSVVVGILNSAETEQDFIFSFSLSRIDNGEVLDKGIMDISLSAGEEDALPIVLNTDYLGDVKFYAHLYTSEASDATATRLFTTRSDSGDKDEGKVVRETEKKEEGCDCPEQAPQQQAPQVIQYSPPDYKWILIIGVALLLIVAIGIIVQFIFVKKRFALGKFMMEDKSIAPESKRVKKEVFEEKIRNIQNKLR